MKSGRFYFQPSFIFLFVIGVLAVGRLSTVLAQGEEEELKEGQLPELGVYFPMKEGEGGFGKIRIVNSKFQVYFMDEGKKVKEPVYSSAFIRYENVAKKDIEERYSLHLSGDGQYLTSKRFVRPPFDFWISPIPPIPI